MISDVPQNYLVGCNREGEKNVKPILPQGGDDAPVLPECLHNLQDIYMILGAFLVDLGGLIQKHWKHTFHFVCTVHVP